MKKTIYILIFLVLPAVFMFTGFRFNRTVYSNDPEYAYLLNGINIANLRYVGHTDNPGTTVQTYSAIVLRISHFLRFNVKDDLQTDVLKNPDYFLEIERKGLILINTLLFFILGVIAYWLTRNLWFGLLLQITPFLSANLLEHAWTKISPEPVLIMAVSFLIILILSYYHSSNRSRKIYPWLFALVMGFGLATKATFLPLLIIPFLLLEGKKQKVTFIAAIIPSFVLFTIPAIPAYPHMAKWFLGLSTHTGTYGQGSTGIIDPVQYVTDFVSIVKNNTGLTVVIIFTIMLFLILLTRKSIIHWIKEHETLIYSGVIVLAQLGGVLMVSKHYHANHYLIPENSLTGLAFVFLILFVSSLVKSQKAKPVLAPVLFVLLTVCSLLNIPYLKAADYGYIISNKEYYEIKNRLDTEFTGYVKSYYYPTSINPYSALRWGNVYSRTVFNHSLQEIYPEGLFYDNRSGNFQWWESELAVSDFVSKYGKKILLVGGPLTSDERKTVEKNGLALKEIYLGRTQAIYEIDTLSSSLLNAETVQPLWTVIFDADSLTADGKMFVSGTHEIINNWHQTTEAAHSGKFSAKLSGQNIYAFEFRLDSVQPGDEFRVTVWRKGGQGTTYLVAATQNNTLYKQSETAIASSPDGWQQISLRFNVPVDTETNGLKVYAWNNSSSAVYLDDFTVSRLK